MSEVQNKKINIMLIERSMAYNFLVWEPTRKTKKLIDLMQKNGFEVTFFNCHQKALNFLESEKNKSINFILSGLPARDINDKKIHRKFFSHNIPLVSFSSMHRYYDDIFCCYLRKSIRNFDLDQNGNFQLAHDFFTDEIFREKLVKKHENLYQKYKNRSFFKKVLDYLK